MRILFKHRTETGHSLMVTALISICFLGLLLQPFSALRAQPPQGPKVDVEVLAFQELRLWHEYSGRLAAVERVEVKPQVSGTIVEVRLRDGALVKAGDLLYVIDPRPFAAEVASAKAALQAAESRVKLADTEISRAHELIDKKLVSQSHFDVAQNDYLVALAAVDAAKAQLQRAELDLEYAHIKAPVSGRVSRAEITLGNLVESGSNAPVLTTIVSSDKLYAEFDVDEDTYLQLIRQSGSRSGMPVRIRLSDDGQHNDQESNDQESNDRGENSRYQGEIYAFDNQLNTTTGTIRARAILENRDGVLIPGMFAKVRVAAQQKERVLTVPERAVGTNQSKKFVYVVTEENKVAYREVELGNAIDGNRVVRSGLEAGEKIMVNGLQRVQPDMQVTPVVVNRKNGLSGEDKGEVARN